MIHRIALAGAVALFGIAATTASAEYRVTNYAGPDRGTPMLVPTRVRPVQAPYALTGAAPSDEVRRDRGELRMIPVSQGGSRVTYIYSYVRD